jgi:predicted metal-dependent hydrolase
MRLAAEPLILGNMQLMVDERRELVVAGEILDLRVERKRVKNINVRLRGNILYVSAPHRVPKTELDEKIERLALQLVRRRRADTVNADGAAEAMARKVASRFDEPPRVTEVRFATTQRSRWGRYSLRTGIVRLNAALRLMPPWVLEAVVAHELAHVFHPDHSPAFWKLARTVYPKTDRARAFLEGVSWLASSWEDLPPIERAQLSANSEES